MLEREITLEITKEKAPYAPEEELGTYIIRRWSWREKQAAILGASTLVDERSNIASIDVVGYEINQMICCIREAPEGLELSFDRFNGRKPSEGEEGPVEAIEGLDADVGTLLLTACRKVNGLAEGDRRDFLLRTEPEEKADILG